MSESAMDHAPEGSGQNLEYEFDPGRILFSFFRVMTHLLTRPGTFFEGMPPARGYRSPLVFLFLCSVLFTVGASTYLADGKGLFALVFFANSMVMPFFSALILHIVVGMLFGRRSYETLFRVHAYASITQLAAWIPFFSYITEPWRLFLISAGLAKACGLKWSRALLSVVITFIVILMFIWSLQPVMVFLKR